MVKLQTVPWKRSADPRELSHLYRPEEIESMTPEERDWLDGVIKAGAHERDRKHEIDSSAAAYKSIDAAHTKALADQLAAALVNVLTAPRVKTGTITVEHEDGQQTVHHLHIVERRS